MIWGRKMSRGADAHQLFDETPKRIEVDDFGVDLMKSGESNAVEFIESLIQENCVSSIDVGEVKVDVEDEVFDDDWQGMQTTELEKLTYSTDHNQWLLRSLLMRIGRIIAMMLKTTQLNVPQVTQEHHGN